MSGDVVSLAEQRPHLSGEAVCLACKHRWAAVAPVGTVCLECPQCGTGRGVWAGVCLPATDECLQCECGSAHFILTRRNGAICAKCGLYPGDVWS